MPINTNNSPQNNYNNPPTKVINLQTLVEHPQSLKLLILHTPYKLQISTLWKCTNLIKLDLSKNNLCYFPYIGNLSNLKFMFIHENKLDFQQLKGIFYSQQEQTQQFSLLSKSILWVTYYGNKNMFIARHFLINSTTCIAIDNHMVVNQERNVAIDINGEQNNNNRIRDNYIDNNNNNSNIANINDINNDKIVKPFDQITDITDILKKQTTLNKNATEEQYMCQFWEEMKILRKKTQKINPVIKIQKIFRGWILRKKIKDKKNQLVQSIQLKSLILKQWKLLTQRNKKLLQILKLKNKQHLLLPIRQMKKQHINRKISQWTSRAKKKVLLRKLSLVSQVRFFGILRSNVLMFKSLYDCMYIQSSNFVVIDIESFKKNQNILREMIKGFHGEETFEVENNRNYMIRQAVEGGIKKGFAIIMSLNQRSYVVRLFRNNYNSNKYKKTTKLSSKQYNTHKSICSLPSYSTNLKSLYTGLHKIHFNRKQYQHSHQLIQKMDNNQKLMLKQYIVLKSSNNRILKDLIRCVYFINIGVFDKQRQQPTILIQNDSAFPNYTKKIQIYSQQSLNKLSAVTFVQTHWRGYIARKKQRQLIHKILLQRRSIIKIQRWIRKLKYKKRQIFKKQLLYIMKNITDRYFYVELKQYMMSIRKSQSYNIQNKEDQWNSNIRMKFLEQNLSPYVDFATKKIILYWDQESNIIQKQQQTISTCYNIKKLPFDTKYLSKIFKTTQKIKQYFNPKSSQQFQRAQLSHLFHFNTWISTLYKQNKSYLKISCNSLQQTKLRILCILLHNYSFSKSFGIKIYSNQSFNKIQQNNLKNIVNKQSIFITKGNIQLKQNNQKIQKFGFKAKMYLNQDVNMINGQNNNSLNSVNNGRPKKIEQNLLIFIPTMNMAETVGKNDNKIAHDSIIHDNNKNIQQALKPKQNQRKSISLIQNPNHRQKPRLTIQQLQLSQSQSKHHSSSISHPKRRNYSTIRDSQSNNNLNSNEIKKQDLLPTALKRILPLKKQIKSYKIQKRIKIKQQQPSFILDNVTKCKNNNQRFLTQPNEKNIYDYEQSISIQQKPSSFITHPRNPNNNNNNIQPQPSSSSSIRDKIRKQYITRKQLLKSQKSQSSFYQNFTNINNFIQQQQLYEQIRKIKTQSQIQSYTSAKQIKQSIEKSYSNINKAKQYKLLYIEKQNKQHKDKVIKVKKQMEKQKEQIQRARSVERQKQSNKQQPKRLKVSFAEECFPIINRSYNNQICNNNSNQDDSSRDKDIENNKDNNSKIKKWSHINTQYK